MSNYAFRIRATKEYYDLLNYAFLYYLDFKDFTYIIDNRDQILSLYKTLNDPFNHRPGDFFLDLCFLYEEAFDIFRDVIGFCLSNANFSYLTELRFFYMFSKFFNYKESVLIILC